MSKKDNVKGYDDKKTINCLITISATPLRNPYKLMACEKLELARFI